MDKHETPKDDFEPEVSDIPGDELPPIPEALVTLGAQFSPRSHAWRLTTVVGTIFFVLLVILSTFPSARDEALDVLVGPTSAPTLSPILKSLATLTAHSQATAASRFRVAMLDPAPGDCPATALLQDFDPITFDPGVGAYPVWVTGFNGPRAQLVQLDPGREQPANYGWAYRLLLVERSDSFRPVLLSGENLQGNAPLLFEDGISIRGHTSVTAFFSLAADHPRLPSKYDDQWKAWTVIMYVPSAGCYSLQAFWPEGGWQVNFAAGR